MKSYNGLFEAMIQIDEIKSSIREASKNRSKHKSVKNYLEHIDENAENLLEQLQNETWNPPKHKIHIIQEGAHKKERTIQKPIWNNEQIVHHIVIRQFRQLVLKRLPKCCVGSIKGRSVHYLLKCMNGWVKSYGNKRFYVAELDIKKFYDSIDDELLIERLNKVIRDKRYMNLMSKIIRTSSPGLPKGFYTSPLLAHFYFLPADNYILQELKPDHYARYVDNLWIFSRNKKRLHEIVNKLKDFLLENMRLHLKDNWQVFRFEDRNKHGRAINLLGFVIHRGHISIRKGILKRARSKAYKIKRQGGCSIIDAQSMVSRIGWFKYADAHKYYQKYIRPNVSIKYCKHIISKHSKRSGIYEKLAHST